MWLHLQETAVVVVMRVQAYSSTSCMFNNNCLARSMLHLNKKSPANACSW